MGMNVVKRNLTTVIDPKGLSSTLYITHNDRRVSCRYLN